MTEQPPVPPPGGYPPPPSGAGYPPPAGQARRQWMDAHQVIGALPKQAYTSWIRRVGAFIIDQILWMILSVILGCIGGLIAFPGLVWLADGNP